MAKHRHILGATALTKAAILFTKADSKAPMAGMFSPPMLPHRLGKTHRLTRKGGQEKSLRHRPRTVHCDVGLDEANTSDGGP